MVVAQNESTRATPDAWPILLDEFGNVCEGLGSNLFTVSDGVLRTPGDSHVLAGISRATTLELAREAGIETHETAITPYDLAQADEAFLTSTSLCLCPVATVDGRALREPRVPGPVTERLQQAWKDLVGLDFVAQHARFATA
jgi:branched-chain amino acid aminotransferase